MRARKCGAKVADVKAQAARLKELGVRRVGKALAVGGLRTQYACDLEGNLFALVQAPQR